MARYEARLKTSYGEIVVNFDTLEELKSSLEGLDVTKATEILRSKFEGVIATEPRKPKPGLEKLCSFTRSGLVELAYVPDALTKPELVALVMFAYHPEPATTEQIFLSSGVKNAASDYLTHPSYKRFWWKTQEGKYVLSEEGLKWVSTKIQPKLMAIRNESKEKPSEATSASQ